MTICTGSFGICFIMYQPIVQILSLTLISLTLMYELNSSENKICLTEASTCNFYSNDILHDMSCLKIRVRPIVFVFYKVKEESE